jgi:hypothetical protein
MVNAATCLVALVVACFVSFVLAVFFGWSPIHLVAVVAVAALAFAARRMGARGLEIVTLACSVPVLVELVLLVANMMSWHLLPFWPQSSQALWDGGGDIGSFMTLLAVRLFFSGLLGTVGVGIAFLAGFGLARWTRVRTAQRTFAVVAAVALLGTSALVAAGLVRRWGRSGPDSYVASMPIVNVSVEHLPKGKDRFDLGDGRRWAGRGCSGMWWDDNTPPPMGTSQTFGYPRGPDGNILPPDPPPPPSPVEVRAKHDAISNVWVLECVGATDVTEIEHWSQAVSVAELAPSLGPPSGWLAAAAIAVVAGALLVWRGARDARRANALPAGKEGTHIGKGQVRFAGEEAVDVPAANKLPVGPVVVTMQGTPVHAGYRGPPIAAVAQAAPGTLADAIAATRERATGSFAIAIACAAFGGVPLVVAAVYGLM